MISRVMEVLISIGNVLVGFMKRRQKALESSLAEQHPTGVTVCPGQIYAGLGEQLVVSTRWFFSPELDQCLLLAGLLSH